MQDVTDIALCHQGPPNHCQRLPDIPYGSPHHDVRSNAGVSLHNIDRIGPLSLALPYTHTIVMHGNAEPRFIAEHGTWTDHQSMPLSCATSSNVAIAALMNRYIFTHF